MYKPSSQHFNDESIAQAVKTLRLKYSNDDGTMMIVSNSKKSSESKRHLSIKNKSHRFSKAEFLGEGGMKVIKLLKDKNMKRMVARATLHPKNMTQDNIDMFIREAQLTAALEHPNIIPIYDIGKNKKGEPYFIMKHLDGLSLHQILYAINNGEEGMKDAFTLDKLINIFIEICDTIDFAHQKHILHLDIKPDNIHISSEGKVYVIDWGLSKILKNNKTQHSKTFKELVNEQLDSTNDKDIKGTPGYMASEQIYNKKNLSPKTDIYGLGSLLYTILCYDAPVNEANIKDNLIKTIEGDIQKPSERRPDLNINKTLENIAMKAISPLPENRYKNVKEMIAELNLYVNGKSKVFQIVSVVLISVALLSGLITYFLFNQNNDDKTNVVAHSNSTNNTSISIEPKQAKGKPETIFNSGWTPAQLKTLAWFDAKDLKSISISNNNKVNQWNDKSGNKKHATKYKGKRPSYFKPYIEGSRSKSLDLPKDIYSDQTQGMLILVGKQTDRSGSWGAYGDESKNASVDEDLIFHDSFLSTKNSVLGPIEKSILNKQVILTYVNNGNTLEIFINGKSQGITKTTFDNTPTYANLFGNKGKYLLYEIIFLPDSQYKDIIEGYLAHKWGQVEHLPDNHTYKKNPP